jgi:hypothetical protein
MRDAENLPRQGNPDKEALDAELRRLRKSWRVSGHALVAWVDLLLTQQIP